MKKNQEKNIGSQPTITIVVDRNTIRKGRTISIEEAYTDGGSYDLVLPSEMLQQTGMHDGDDIVFIANDDGSLTIKKV